MILIDSVYIKDKNCYPQVFLEKYRHIARKKKKSFFITDNIEICSDVSGDPDDSNKKTKMKIN